MLPSVKAMGTPIGHLEHCGNGRQLVTPSSIRPETGKPQEFAKKQSRDILTLEQS